MPNLLALRRLALALVATAGCAGAASPFDAAAPTDLASPSDAVPTSDAASPSDASPADAAVDAAPLVDRPPPPDGSLPAADSSFVFPEDADDDRDASPLVQARPYAAHVPPSYRDGVAMPLVVLLHGYAITPSQIEAYFNFVPLSDAHGFLLATPGGLVDQTGNPFWNATDACHDVFHTGVDDVAYLTAVVDDMSARFAVDPRRIYFAGHSTGGFMSHRMACDRADRVAAIASLAGANWADAARCAPSAPVAVLQVHGDGDAVIQYEGGITPMGPYPSALATVGVWGARNRCSGDAALALAPIDLEPTLAGPETDRLQWRGCAADVELWTIHGGTHGPTFDRRWGEAVWAFFAAHPKP
ncbi:MAG: uncharacterized protein JWM10_2311 [Myxococcaceae bacterium]|nr:uncharacterized protein [Myxococcaceae bacterium]